MNMLTHIVVLAGILCLVKGFPEGAPVFKCADGYPYHDADAQTSPAPYTFTFDKTSYNPGDAIQVTLSGSNNAEIGGLVLRVTRTAGDTDTLLGSFSNLGSKLQAYDFYGIKNCISHKGEIETTTVTATWTAPASSVGDVVFKATVVEDEEVFWVDITSSIITANTATQDAGTPKVVSNTMVVPDFSADCGVTKGCFLYPSIDCSGNDCRYAVSYLYDAAAATIDFEVMGEADSYLSLGYSTDLMMGEDETVNCIAGSNGIYDIHHGFNNKAEKFNEIHDMLGITNLKVMKKDNKIYCSFRRPVSVTMTANSGDPYVNTLKDVKFDFSTDKYHFFLARGKTFPNSRVTDEHDELPLLSYSKIDYTAKVITRGSALNPMIKAHGALAVFSWFFLAGSAVVLARHYKKPFGSMIGGAATWFQLHRACMLSGVILSVIAVIIILVYAQGWNEDAMVHGILGLITVILGLTQVAMSFFRCAPDSDNRWVFNYAHRITGVSALIFSVATIFIGFNMELIDNALRKPETITMAVWLVFVVILDVILEIVTFRAKQGGVGPNNSGNQMTLSEGERKTDYKSIYIIIFAMLCIVAFSCFIACVALLGLA